MSVSGPLSGGEMTVPSFFKPSFSEFIEAALGVCSREGSPGPPEQASGKPYTAGGSHESFSFDLAHGSGTTFGVGTGVSVPGGSLPYSGRDCMVNGSDPAEVNVPPAGFGLMTPQPPLSSPSAALAVTAASYSLNAPMAVSAVSPATQQDTRNRLATLQQLQLLQQAQARQLQQLQQMQQLQQAQVQHHMELTQRQRHQLAQAQGQARPHLQAQDSLGWTAAPSSTTAPVLMSPSTLSPQPQLDSSASRLLQPSDPWDQQQQQQQQRQAGAGTASMSSGTLLAGTLPAGSTAPEILAASVGGNTVRLVGLGGGGGGGDGGGGAAPQTPMQLMTPAPQLPNDHLQRHSLGRSNAQHQRCPWPQQQQQQPKQPQAVSPATSQSLSPFSHTSPRPCKSKRVSYTSGHSDFSGTPSPSPSTNGGLSPPGSLMVGQLSLSDHSGGTAAAAVNNVAVALAAAAPPTPMMYGTVRQPTQTEAPAVALNPGGLSTPGVLGLEGLDALGGLVASMQAATAATAGGGGCGGGALAGPHPRPVMQQLPPLPQQSGGMAGLGAGLYGAGGGSGERGVASLSGPHELYGGVYPGPPGGCAGGGGGGGEGGSNSDGDTGRQQQHTRDKNREAQRRYRERQRGALATLQARSKEQAQIIEGLTREKRMVEQHNKMLLERVWKLESLVEQLQQQLHVQQNTQQQHSGSHQGPPPQRSQQPQPQPHQQVYYEQEQSWGGLSEQCVSRHPAGMAPTQTPEAGLGSLGDTVAAAGAGEGEGEGEREDDREGADSVAGPDGFVGVEEPEDMGTGLGAGVDLGVERYPAQAGSGGGGGSGSGGGVDAGDCGQPLPLASHHPVHHHEREQRPFTHHPSAPSQPGTPGTPTSTLSGDGGGGCMPGAGGGGGTDVVMYDT